MDVREDDGDVGYRLVPSAWTEERHGVLPTATLFRGTPGKREKLGREREVAARGRRGEVGLGFAAPWGSCSAREQVGRGPATVVVRRACLCLSARTTVTKDGVGPGCSERERERSGAGPCCAAGCSRAVVGDWAGPLAGLVASRAAFFFFF